MFRSRWIIANNAIHKIILTLSKQLEIEYLGDSGAYLESLIYKWIEAYKNQRKSPVALPLILSSLPLFTQKVLYAIQTIPLGKTASYKEIATKIGKPHAVRAVGNICQHNPFPLVIPCHRIIRSNGKIGGYSCGIELKQRLLDFEKSKPLSLNLNILRGKIIHFF